MSISFAAFEVEKGGPLPTTREQVVEMWRTKKIQVCKKGVMSDVEILLSPHLYHS
jgi:hypothetical protein